MNFFATTPKGLELLLVEELRSLGAVDPAEKLAGVTFTGDLAVAYRACLWSRLANRILLRLAQVPASTPEELYAGVQTILWDEHLEPDGTLNVNFVCTQSKITHTLYGSQKVKDAIVDQLREKYNQRPNVARDNPDVSVHVYLYRDVASISIDLSGESLHKRGYRLDTGAAPLKENLAAAILLRVGWKKIAEQHGMLFDPMCGSGTLLIEAALMAGDIAPGLLRDYFGFLRWKKHDAALWERILQEAKQRREQGVSTIPTLLGYDEDPSAIKVAFANIERANLRSKIHVEKHELSEPFPKKDVALGLFVTNPPYGERLGETSELQSLYEQLGAKLKQEFVGWHAAVFTGNPELGKKMGLRSRKTYALFNGAIPCQLLLFDVQPEWFVDRSPAASNERRIRKAQKSLSERDQEFAQMFANRIRKNLKTIKRWAEKENISCYRVYDADLPEYAVKVDFYGQNVVVEEYQAPQSVDQEKAQKRLQHVLAVLPEALNIPMGMIFLRNRDEHTDSFDAFFQAEEGDAKFLVNLRDANFAVGLSLEQRQLRAIIREQAKGKHFLNVFSGSGAITISAVLGNAATTKSIDEEEVNLEWLQQNLALNGLENTRSNQLVNAEIGVWVLNEKARYNLIFAELPASDFRLRQEHRHWVLDLANLLSADGVLYLAAGDSRLKLAPDLFEMFAIEDITPQINPTDFARHPRAYQCWKLTR